MSNEVKQYITRIKAGLRPDLTSLVRFIKEETFLNLKPYSFVGHEYQQYFCELVEKDPNVDITAEKCSQIGLSEICFRIVLGQMSLNPGYSVIYAMPSKSFAMEVLKTRIAPIIDQSPQLKSLISREVDSASVKMFKNGSILFALGASANSSSSLINRPVTLALTDELDKCDYATHTGLRSRQTHSINKPRIAVSTPTAPGIGINAEADGRQLHYRVAICNHCQKEFVPDYYTQVKVPGFNEPLSTLTTEKVRSQHLDIDKAFHHCPHCKSIASNSFRWEIENPELRKIHLRLTPFDAPSFISPADLVTSQLTYSSRAEFDNQSLGLPSQLSDASIDRADIKFVHDEVPSGLPIAGLDLGKSNYYMQGSFTNGVIFVHNMEVIPVGNLERDVDFNIHSQKIISMVSDSLPFLDVVHRLTSKHPMFWGSIYSVPMQPQPELYKLKINEEDQVRQVNIQKNLFMDHVAGMIASQQIVFKSGPFDAEIVQHFTDMRRMRDHKFSELRYKWVKSVKGIDHWWHALVYLVCASKLFEKSYYTGGLPISSLLTTFKKKVDV